MRRILNQFRRAPLFRRIALFTMLFGLLLSAVLQATLAMLSYENSKAQIQTCLKDELEQRYASLTEAIWAREQSGVTRTLSEIELACHPLGDAYSTFFWRIDLRDQERWLERGSNLQKQPTHTIEEPISYWRLETDGYGIGVLTISVSYQAVFQQVVNQFWQALLWHGLVLLVCAVFALQLGNLWMVARTRNFLKDLDSYGSDEMIQRVAKQETTELSTLWQFILKSKTDSEFKILEARQQVENAEAKYHKALRDVEAKNQFIASLSHDLRTPMNGLIGFSALLSESDLNETQKEYANTIKASLESLLHVINDVLDLSRVESGELHVNSIPFSLRGVVSGVISLLRFRAQSKGIDLETRIAAEIPNYMRGDPARIRQLLTNLVSNAIKYTSKGYILIDLELVSGNREDCTVRLSIEDTGLPIEERGQISSQLDQPGHNRFSNELREKRSISLEASEKLARLMGGQLLWENAEQRGATYWFDLRLPLVQSIDGGTVLDRSSLQHVFVVVIDTLELSRRITLELLEGWGVAFDTVSDTNALKDVVELYRGDDYILVLLDDRLEQGNSFGLVRSLASELGQKGGVIVLSSYPQLGDAEGFFLAGAVGFLSKQDRDPYLRDVICQVYAERESNVGRDRRLVTRYTVQDLGDSPSDIVPVWSVLVVEENIVNQQLIARALEQNDCRVDIATNGFEAIELFKSDSYDLIFMDCELSEMDGYETCQILCEIERSQKRSGHTPTIALLESSLESDQARCYQVGMDDILPKPIKLSALKMVLQKHLG
ncbi:MAG: hypothetical protein C9356_16015 [Oleiphilus sp.]|nr:MAG: hypothetical protein C9356_16015 [Oleiphilus sp.]